MPRTIDDMELYALFKASPLLTEATKVIIESKDGISVSEIAKMLHKKEPTVHKAVRRLRLLSLVALKTEGRRKAFRVVPKRKAIIESILAKLYYPTKGFVTGELLRGDLNVTSVQNGAVKGMCFTHTMDIVYYYEREVRVGEDFGSVGIIILHTLDENEILSVGGRLVDIQDGGSVGQGFSLDGVLLVVIEDGSTHEAFSKLERYLKVISERVNISTATVLIEKKNPRNGIDEAQHWAASVLKER
jgi:DNA-binding MarR family transcriptional regulator